jgi:hypothetical protein
LKTDASVSNLVLKNLELIAELVKYTKCIKLHRRGSKESRPPDRWRRGSTGRKSVWLLGHRRRGQWE